MPALAALLARPPENRKFRGKVLFDDGPAAHPVGLDERPNGRVFLGSPNAPANKKHVVKAKTARPDGKDRWMGDGLFL